MTTGFGMGFGTANSAPAFGTTPAPAFGATNTAFGTGTTSLAPTFGTGTTTFGFGAAPTTATGTGFTFGQPTTSASTGFSFGQTQSSTPANTGFTFGAPTTATVTPFSFGGIGTTTTAAPTFGFGGLGATTTTTASGFSFGQPTGFGTTTGFANTGFGTTGGFGSTLPAGTTTAFGAVPAVDNTLVNIATAITCPLVYGDERDGIIAKWNQLQAFWGMGKGYYASNAPPVEFTSENPFSRFKTVGYTCIPSTKPEDGLVSLIFNKSEPEVKAQQQQIIECLQRVFGSKPNISVCVESLRSSPDQKTELVIYLMDKLPTGTTNRIAPTEVCTYLEQSNVKTQLAGMGITGLRPKIGLSKEQMNQYLENAPLGIEPFLWQQARLDNPNPEKLIPVPLIGFADLHCRMKCQEHETAQHQQRLDIVADDIAELNRRYTTTVAKIAENKRKLVEFQHRVLKMLVLQEVTRKMGFSVQAEEEQLHAKLEAIHAELSAPTQFKGHLKELISQIRMQSFKETECGEGERYMMDEVSKHKIKEHLRLQQEGIAHLIAIIKEDMLDLKAIEDASRDNNNKHR